MVAARCRPAVLLLLSLVGGHAARLQPAPPATAEPDPPCGPARRRIPLARVTGAGAVLAAAPLCYRLGRYWLGRGSGEVAAEVEAAASAAGEATVGTTSAAAGSSDGAVEQQAESGDGARLTLSPERLAQIGRLSEDLTCLTAELVNVPAFFVAFGNTSEPISVPHGDSERIAYFFVEAMDAELFRRRLQQHSPDAQLQVAALSLSQVIAAYSSEEARAAEVRDRFVLIPTMGAVTAATELMTELPPPDVLSAASGLVPIFHIPSLLAQSASGKQRRILFFRKADALNMFRNISLSQGDPEMPSEPERVLVSDLQTIAAAISRTGDSADDLVFAPSSAALRVHRGAAAQGRAPPTPEPLTAPGLGATADARGASLGFDDDDEEEEAEEEALA